jgi:hypothetical protein
MALQFVGKDPESGADNCPAVFVEEETGDLLFQGGRVEDAAMLADAAKHSRMGDSEGMIRLPARMRAMILEALNGQGAAVQRVDRGDDTISGPSGDTGRIHAL